MIALSVRGAHDRPDPAAGEAGRLPEPGRALSATPFAMISVARGASLAAAVERSELSTLQAASSMNSERLRICRGCIERVGQYERKWNSCSGKYHACECRRA